MPWLPGCLAATLAALLVGCAAAPPRPLIAPFEAKGYQGFLVRAPLLPFELQGAAMLMWRGERETGDLSLEAQAGPSFRLELRAPLTGGVALDVRISPTRLLVIDYGDETYLRLANTPQTRQRLFDVNLTPNELQTLLTGRVSRARFAAGGGQLDAAARRAEFSEDGAVQRFRLDAQGLPTEWRKERNGTLLFRVEYLDYLTLAQPDGASLRLPRKVRLYTDGGPAQMVMGVRTFSPGGTNSTPWSVVDLPASARHFVPGELPAAQ